MDDIDLIARVYPFEDDKYRYAQVAIEDAGSRYMPPKVARQEMPKIRFSRSARESTEPPQTSKDQGIDALPYLELRFSDVPRTSWGLVFGFDRTCDIVLPKVPGISKRHFALTYKNKFEDGLPRLIVRDLGSRFGTIVSYDGAAAQQRSKFDWIIDGFTATHNVSQLIVEPYEHLKFQVIVARHDITSPAYIESVEQFRRGASGAETLLHDLGLQDGPKTERNTGAHTPVDNPILLRRGQIARGGFGVVSRHWNVSSGEEYAAKEPADNRYVKEDWEKEINTMHMISHVHIVRLCFAEMEPQPALYLEYMPFGNLEDEHNRAHFSPEECLVILRQSLLALTYLHGLPQPVAHRDLKPENILVKHRDPGGNPDHLHVKLSDFGLSKAGSLKTFCGSRTYCPPEVRDSGTPYTKAVDVWSLGVVILRFAYSLPHPGHGIGMGWCQKVVEEVNDWESEGLIDILQCMLVIEPQARHSAPACLQLVLSLGDRSATPTPTSYDADYDAPVAYVVSEGYGQEEQEAPRILPHEQFVARSNHQISGVSVLTHFDGGSESLDEDSDDLYEARGTPRLNDYSTDLMGRTTATTGKRTKRASTSSSGRTVKRRTSISSQSPETFRTVLQDSQRFDTFVAQTAQGQVPDWDDPSYYFEESAELVDAQSRSEWPGSGSKELSALVGVGSAAHVVHGKESQTAPWPLAEEDASVLAGTQ